MSKIAKLEDLEIYQESLLLTKEIFELCKKPVLKHEYSLCDQIKRSAISVSANISEGYGRSTKADFSRFLSIALGSTNETTALLDVIKINFGEIEIDSIRERYVVLSKRIYSFRRKVCS